MNANHGNDWHEEQLIQMRNSARRRERIDCANTLVVEATKKKNIYIYTIRDTPATNQEDVSCMFA